MTHDPFYEEAMRLERELGELLRALHRRNDFYDEVDGYGIHTIKLTPTGRARIADFYMRNMGGELICEATFEHEYGLAKHVKARDVQSLGEAFFELLADKAEAFAKATQVWETWEIRFAQEE